MAKYASYEFFKILYNGLANDTYNYSQKYKQTVEQSLLQKLKRLSSSWKFVIEA